MFELLSIYLSQLVARFSRDDEGAAIVEYGLLVGLLALALAGTLTLFATQVGNWFATISTALLAIAPA